MKTLSCIIPAYNEAQGITNTLQAAVGADIFSEIIVVDDGSRDETPTIVRGFPAVKLLINKQNLGKSGAVARGIGEATSEYVLLLDADLLGLKAEHLRALAAPVLEGAADVTISIRQNTPGWMKAVGIDCMSGERVLPRTLLVPELKVMSRLRSFELEVFINRLLIAQRLRIKSVYWPGVNNHFKWRKYSFWSGVRHEVGLWRDILSFLSPWEFVTQNIQLRTLLV